MFIHVIINGAVEQEKLEYLGMLQVEQVKALNEETELWVKLEYHYTLKGIDNYIFSVHSSKG